MISTPTLSGSVRPRSRLGLVLLALLPLACGPATAPPPAKTPAKTAPVKVFDVPVKAPASPRWDTFKKLVEEQKYEAAAKEVEAILAEARAAGKGMEQARALITTVQLRTALHGYETAVRHLREQPWPEGALPKLVLRLYYGHALVTYLSAYSWEIRQREQVVSKAGEVDLKRWTGDQIFAEAQRAYDEVWQARASMGTHPVDILDDYVHKNSYPEGVRGTLRGAVTYLFVELLANTRFWRAEHSNNTYRIDFDKLLAGDPKAASGVEVADPAVHPLLRIGALLDDLEAWHRGAGREEAALEARLERLRRLRASFSRAAQRRAMREHLDQRLAGLEKLPWWSTGMAMLAEFWRDAGDQVTARKVALAGHKAHPDAMGGKRCLHLVRAIEAPEFRLEAMALDGLNRRSLRLTHRNLPRVHLRAYRFDLKTRVVTARDYNLLPNRNEMRAIVTGQKPLARWTVALPPTPDYQNHQTYVVPPLKQKGAYLVVASVSEDFGPHKNRVLGAIFVASDLVTTTRNLQSGALEVLVRSGSSGAPRAGVAVSLYRFQWGRGKRHQVVGTRRTGRDGVAVFRPTGKGRYNAHFVLASRGDDLTLDPGHFRLSARPAATAQQRSLIYTDRSIYRPLQTLHYKVIAYRGNREAADFKVVPRAKLTVSLLDANHQQVAKQQVTTNDFGSASGTFEIPAGRLLGRWRVRASYPGDAWVRVEEYKRPTFEVSLKDTEGDARLGRAVTVKGEARYYFGLPVTDGKVAWRVTRQPVYPWWWGWYWPGATRVQQQVVAHGEARPGADGVFSFAFTPEADPRTGEGKKAKDVTYRFLVNIDFTDEGGETRSASRSFRLGLFSVEARLSSKVGFFRAGQPLTIAAKRTNLDGAARPGKGRWQVFALKQPAKAVPPADLPLPPPDAAEDGKTAPYQTPGDRLRPRWSPGYSRQAEMARWPDGKRLGGGELTHGKGGGATITLPGLPPGPYRLRYTTRDPSGAEFSTFKEFVVAGKRLPLALPLAVIPEQTSLQVGDTARLLVHSGLPGQTILLELFSGGKLRQRRQIRAGGDPVVTFRLTEKDRGGFGYAVSLVRDHQYIARSGSFYLPWDNKQLKVEFIRFRDRLRPGQKETWTVKVSHAGGKRAGRAVAAGAAEVLAYMYDRSLDLFAPHSPPTPASLFPWRTSVPWSRANLRATSVSWLHNDLVHLPLYPSPSPDRLVFLSGYGIGGMGRGGFGRGRGRLMRIQESGAVPQPSAMADAPAPPPRRSPPAAQAKLGALNKKQTTPTTTESAGAEKSRDEGAAAPAAGTQVRKNFTETAFFLPHLGLDKDGSATITFEVPESVTSWTTYVHAVTRDLASGSTSKQTRTVKDLMVRPYLPRFLREGDRAALKVVVNNASKAPLSGRLKLEILDPESKKSLAAAFGLKQAEQPFTVAAGQGSDLTFALTAPRRVGPAVFRVVATAGPLSDGEQRALPVLPGRMHLVQSRFVTLTDKERRTMVFSDMAQGDDPTLEHDSLVVTLDAQLFYTVLNALPYLVNYPYECTEQTLNRFLSGGILSSLYGDYPAVARMAKKLSARKTRLTPWEVNDPNRKMTLEESPWLIQSRGGKEAEEQLARVLDPKIAQAVRDAALRKLQKAQTGSGGFPWFPGGPPSPYITLYLMHGMAKALEFGVDVPKTMVRRAWSYLARHFRQHYVQHMIQNDCCWEFLTFLNYVASAYPDPSWTGSALTADERKKILAFSFGHWKEHSPLLKAYLALTLRRMGRPDDGKLVFDSVMDSAKTKKDQGTFWAPEDRAWLWYNDTIETHAFALRTLSELRPKDSRLDGLVMWLLINKKLNHWKSTRATAEVIYALAHHLKKTGALGVREEAKVTIGQRPARTFAFEPDTFVGKVQMQVPGAEIKPKQDATITVEKSTKGTMFASATWHFSTEKLPEEARGDFFAVTRTYYKREIAGGQATLKPLAEGTPLSPGDQVEVHISLRSKHKAEYVHLRDPRAAGLEPENAVSRHRWDLGISWYEEIRDSGTNFFFEALPVGEYTFKYRLRANMAGTFKVAPATIQCLYAPEFAAYSAGDTLTIAP